MSVNVVASIEELKKAYESEVEKIRRQFDEKRNLALEPARKRLQEIREARAKLDREEEEILAALGEPIEGKKRRTTGRRMTAQHKKSVLGKYVSQGYIKHGAALSKELRTALKDEGLGTNDFRILGNYLPPGWEARSNGLRGIAAETVFYYNG